MRFVARLAVPLAIAGLLLGCGGTLPVQRQKYSDLRTEKVFEDEEFPRVWKAIEASLRGYRIIEREPEEADEVELRRLTERRLLTDWVFGQSRDKYVEFQVNGLPKRQALATKVRLKVEAKRVLGGISVRVQTEEEVEMLKKDGSSAGYESVGEPDTSRAHDALQKIEQTLHERAGVNS